MAQGCTQPDPNFPSQQIKRALAAQDVVHRRLTVYPQRRERGRYTESLEMEVVLISYRSLHSVFSLRGVISSRGCRPGKMIGMAQALGGVI